MPAFSIKCAHFWIAAYPFRAFHLDLYDRGFEAQFVLVRDDINSPIGAFPSSGLTCVVTHSLQKVGYEVLEGSAFKLLGEFL